MGLKERIADEIGSSPDGINYTSGKLRIQKQVIAAVAATATGDANTALTASTTTYHILGKLPKAGIITSAIVRSEAAGVAGATIDIFKVASGTAVTSGTAIVTQIAGNALTGATDLKLAVVTTGAQNIAAGSLIVAKIVTGASETLKPPFFDIEILL